MLMEKGSVYGIPTNWNLGYIGVFLLLVKIL